MKHLPQTLLALAAMFGLTPLNAAAAVHYVDVNSTNATPPYTDWATAAATIQDAVNAAAAGDEVVVTNGTYTGGGDSYSRVLVGASLTVRSVNGSEVTTIDGGGKVRCAILSYGATLSGFTLTHGFASGYYTGSALGRGGAGVLCVGTNPASIAVITNSVITANRVFANMPTLRTMLGGGVYGGTLNSCKLIDNSVSVSTGVAGGTCAASGGGASSSTLNNCTLVGNSANATNGAGTLPSYASAGGGGAFHCTLVNCTLTGNSANAVAPEPSWTLAFGGASECNLSNCVAYFNTDNYGVSPNYDSDSCTLNYCCTMPEPASGFGNITNAPTFLDLAGGDQRLQSNSPCINAGWNGYAPAGPDLDGNLRIIGGTVDIGAYEYQSLSLINFGVVSNQAAFNITDQSNQVVIVETSTNLVDWSPLATNTLSGHPFSFSDPTPATLPQRFYRAQAQ